MNRTMRNFALGLVAGSVALVVSAVFRIFAGGLFIPELASQTLFSLTPGEIESFSACLCSHGRYFEFGMTGLCRNNNDCRRLWPSSGYPQIDMYIF